MHAMIAYRVFITCNGECGRELERNFAARDPQYLPELGRELSQFSKLDKWTVDGEAHWCPACTRERMGDGKHDALESQV